MTPLDLAVSDLACIGMKYDQYLSVRQYPENELMRLVRRLELSANETLSADIQSLLPFHQLLQGLQLNLLHLQ
jgi:hypothetical protein